MSTEIYDFYAIHSDSFEAHNEFINSLKKEVYERQTKAFFKLIIEDFLFSVKNNTSFSESIIMNRLNYIDERYFKTIVENSSDYNYIYRYSDIIKEISARNIDCILNLNFEVYFYHLNNKTIYTFFNNFDTNLITDIISNNPQLNNYDYWDNSDKPKDISKMAWKTREEEYNLIFKDSTSYSNSLYNYKIAQDPLIYSFKILQNMVKYFPEQSYLDEYLGNNTQPREVLINYLIKGK